MCKNTKDFIKICGSETSCPKGIDAACELVQKLMYMKTAKPKAGMRLYINSVGGAVNAGLLIYDALKGLEMEYEVYCIGMAASMAAIILAGGQKGRRFILPHSKVMIHEPLIADGISGSATTIQKTAESIMETKQIAVSLLSADTGKPRAVVEKAISYDNFMNAEEAVAFGVCDEIVERII